MEYNKVETTSSADDKESAMNNETSINNSDVQTDVAEEPYDPSLKKLQVKLLDGTIKNLN